MEVQAIMNNEINNDDLKQAIRYIAIACVAAVIFVYWWAQ